MMNKVTLSRQEIQDNIDRVSAELTIWNFQMNNFNQDPKNNVFQSLEDATLKIHGELYALAEQACEGSYNCGLAQYSKQFYVGETLYEGVASFEYNRHDKTYYFIDDHEFNVSLVFLDANELPTPCTRAIGPGR
jgi:hypothetical protein